MTAIADATHDIKYLQLVIEGADPLAFTAGQYARLTFPGAPTRDYSMASGSGEREIEFHICRVPGGATTQHIHALLKLGDPLLLEGPFGSSYLREQHAGPILCVAGGSGLAPIKGIVEAAVARPMKQPIHVYFGARSERDLYLVDHFEGLAHRQPNLTFTPVLSDAPLGARWRTGFVTDAVAKDLQDFDGWKAYVAGPPPMVEAGCRSVRHAGCGPRTCMPMHSLQLRSAFLDAHPFSGLLKRGEKRFAIEVEVHISLKKRLTLPRCQTPYWSDTAKNQEIKMLRFHIPNMTCGGCAKSVTKALLSVDPQARIETDPPAREVRVDSALDESVFLAVLSEAGYPDKQASRGDD